MLLCCPLMMRALRPVVIGASVLVGTLLWVRCTQAQEVQILSVNGSSATAVITDDQYETNEDKRLDVAAPGVLSNDTAGSATAVLVKTSSHGTLVFRPDGSFRYTPATNFNGSDNFAYRLSGSSKTTATVSITVRALDDPLTAQPDLASTPEDTAVTIPVLANDKDVDGNPLTLLHVSQPAQGLALILAEQIVYTPSLDFHGDATFTYTVSAGPEDVAVAEVKVKVKPVNDLPVALADQVAVTEGSTETFAVLGNDQDVDGDPLTVSSVTPPLRGQVEIVGDQVRYTAPPHYQGSDHFLYTIADGQGGSATAPVTITVRPLNEAPVAQADHLTIAEDNAVQIDVLRNDSDADGDALSIMVLPSNHGQVAAVDSLVYYTPSLNFNGVDSFYYQIHDSAGITATAAVTIIVTPVNDAPVANLDRVITVEDAAITIQVLSNDNDVDGDPLTLTTLSLPEHGQVAQVATSVIYTPELPFYGIQRFTYTVVDEQGGAATGTVEVTVLGLVDDDSDTLLDEVECPPGAPCPDHDGDGVPDHRDIDSDSDGIPDLFENRSANPVNGAAAFAPPVDSDGDDTPDYLDLDSDNDTISDYVEAYDIDDDGLPDFPQANRDGDGDGLDDGFDAILLPKANNATGGKLSQRDTDNDNQRNWQDPDDDGDGVSTANEANSDVNQNGVPDYLDGSAKPQLKLYLSILQKQ